jgi:soluble cytochrome b562
MDVSSSTASTGLQVEAMKKAQDVQAQQVLKTLESVAEQSKEMTAQKTGMGNNINITG